MQITYLYMFIISCFLLIVESTINIVSIVDKNSAFASIVKIHSIIESASDPTSLSLIFLVMPGGNFTTEIWDVSFKQCFPNVAFYSKLWEKPPGLQYLRGSQFEKDVIYARFYLADIFPELNRFIYLDNDLVVTCDLLELHQYPLRRTQYAPPSATPTGRAGTNPFLSKQLQRDPGQISHRGGRNRVVSGRQLHEEGVVAAADSDNNGRMLSAASQLWRGIESSPTAIGFVFDKHSLYTDYLAAHLNRSHSLVERTRATLDQQLFLNGGVFVMDAQRWRQQNLTAAAEKLILENRDGSVFSTSIGDQGVFYLLLQGNIASLPARFNMRRLPKKTVHMLDEGISGIVHFAGTTHGDAEMLCREPLQYPIFLSAVVPLYLSIMASFRFKRPNDFYKVPQSCSEAVRTVSDELHKQGIVVRYNPGKGHFVWPPKERI